MRRVGRYRSLAILALCCAAVAGMAGDTLAQDSDHQIRCMQLQQELAGAQGGGGREELPGIDKQIQNATRLYQGTQAAMEDAGCFERGFLIFGRGLVRSPKCLKMNDQVEDARRQVEQLPGATRRASPAAAAIAGARPSSWMRLPATAAPAAGRCRSRRAATAAAADCSVGSAAAATTKQEAAAA